MYVLHVRYHKSYQIYILYKTKIPHKKKKFNKALFHPHIHTYIFLDILNIMYVYHQENAEFSGRSTYRHEKARCHEDESTHA